MATPKVELKITARDDTRAAIQSVKHGLGSITAQLAGMRASTLKIAAAFATLRFAGGLARYDFFTSSEAGL